MKQIYDISDKGKRQGKSFRYEVGYYSKPNPMESDEIPEIGAKFRRYGDALIYAQWLANAPDPTMVIIRS